MKPSVKVKMHTEDPCVLVVHVSPMKSTARGIHSCKSPLTGWRQKQRGAGSCVGSYPYDRPFQCPCQPGVSPQPPLCWPIHTCLFPFLSPPVSSSPSSHLSGESQLTATSWRGLEASCPRPRASLASGLSRMDRDRVVHTHSTLCTHTGRPYRSYTQQTVFIRCLIPVL